MDGFDQIAWKYQKSEIFHLFNTINKDQVNYSILPKDVNKIPVHLTTIPRLLSTWTSNNYIMCQ